MLWLHISYIVMIYGTSNGPQNDIGNYLGPCSGENRKVQAGSIL